MSKILWKLPVSSTALLGGGAELAIRGRRAIALVFRYETEDDAVRQLALVLQGVESFKCTYYRARDMSSFEAYDQLVNCGSSTWLKEITDNMHRNGASTDGLSHLMIDFDDGPCYEFICSGFQIEDH